jgi:hypothetical protein
MDVFTPTPFAKGTILRLTKSTFPAWLDQEQFVPDVVVFTTGERGLTIRQAVRGIGPSGIVHRDFRGLDHV